MVSEAVKYQFDLFGMAILWGIGIRSAYDILRIFRRVLKHNKLFVYAEDIIFWVSEAFLIYHLLYQFDNGSIRSYTMFGMFLGMLIYSVTLSRFLVRIISKLLNAIIRFLLTPFRFLKRILGRFFGGVYTKIKKIIKYLAKTLKKIGKRVKIKKSSKKNK